MVSNLGCVGLAVPDDVGLRTLAALIIARVEPTSRSDGTFLYRWQDISGARLSIITRAGEVVEFLPSFAGHKSARFGTVTPVAEDVYIAEIIDINGDDVTAAHVEPEDKNVFAVASRAGQPVGNVCITAMGVNVTVHESAEAFALSQENVSGNAHESGNESDSPQPPRMASESFISHSFFNEEAPGAYALLNGIVLTARVETTEITQQPFVAAEVRCIGFEVTLCFPLLQGSQPPKPGNIIGGTVYMIASNSDDSEFEHRTDHQRTTQSPWRRLLRNKRSNSIHG